jgi:hypothetical protein
LPHPLVGGKGWQVIGHEVLPGNPDISSTRSAVIAGVTIQEALKNIGERVQASAADLSKLAEQLKEIVGNFKV